MVIVFRTMEQQGQEQAIHIGQIGLDFGIHNFPERMLMYGSNKRADDVSIERRQQTSWGRPRTDIGREFSTPARYCERAPVRTVAGRTDSNATDALGNVTVRVIHMIDDGLERWPACESNNR